MVKSTEINGTGLSEEAICARIRDSVLEQRLAPGTKLTEESLCNVFGVGRTTVRRAFLLLSRDNIIELEKNKGAVVASPSPESARQVFEARILLETTLLKVVAEAVTPADIDRLRRHLDEEAAALAGAQIARWIRLTGEFHILLAKLSGNAPMVGFLEQLVFQTSLIIALYGEERTTPNCKGDDHALLVDALEMGNGAHAETILTEHLRSIADGLNFNSQSSGCDLEAIFAAPAPAS